MQAESRKNGPKFDFTNNLVSEHKLFMDVARRFRILKHLWKYQIFYNSLIPKEKVAEEVSVFKEKLDIDDKIIFTENKLLTKIALTIYIDCNVLSEVMMSLMRMLRSRVANSIETNELREFAIGFICKDLLGDGTVIHNKANGKIEIVISEENLQSQKEISNVLNHFGIRTNISKNRIYLQTNLNIYLWFLENKAFEGHENRRKLIKAILNNYYIKRLYSRFKNDVSYNCVEFAKEHKLLLPTAQKFLRDNTKRGFLNCNRDKRLNAYTLSSKGQDFIRIIKNAEKELTTL